MATALTRFDPTQPIETLLPFNAAWAASFPYQTSFSLLAGTQHPKILWIGCCDSRVPETTLLGLYPGEVFVHRNIANLVNPTDISLPAAMHYAVEELNVLHIILCGHIGCGGVKASLATTLVGVPEIDNWLIPLKGIYQDHRAMIDALPTAPAQQAALVTLNVQRGVAVLSANSAVAEAMAGPNKLQIHGAIYDVGTGLLSFLEGPAVIEPPLETPRMQVGRFSTKDVRIAPQTITGKDITFAKPYAKPPRIFVGLNHIDVATTGDNPRMTTAATNITTSGFHISIDTWGSTRLNEASCVWLEIPDEPGYSSFLTGTFGLVDDHPWYQPKLQTSRNITFTTPFAAPPTIVTWLTGFDAPQIPECSIKIYASNVTTTGFTMNIDSVPGLQLFGGWTNWLAYPAGAVSGFWSDSFNIGATPQMNNSGNVSFGSMNTLGTPPANIVCGLNEIHWKTGSSMRVDAAIQNATSTGAAWTFNTWADSTVVSGGATYVAT